MRTMRSLTIMLFASLLVGCASRIERSTAPANATPIFHTITLIDADTQPATEPVLPPPPANETRPPGYPVITITTTNLFIYVGGEVKQAGRFAWVDGLTLTNTIAMAGGFTDFAHRSRIELPRRAGSLQRYSYPPIIPGFATNPPSPPTPPTPLPQRL